MGECSVSEAIEIMKAPSKRRLSSSTKLHVLLATLQSCRRMSREIETADEISRDELLDAIAIAELNVLRLLES